MFFIRVEQKSVQLWLTDYLHYTGGGELADTVSYFNNGYITYLPQDSTVMVARLPSPTILINWHIDDKQQM